jgi:hypothetical protein
MSRPVWKAWNSARDVNSFVIASVSEAIQKRLDCFVASLLAMTARMHFRQTMHRSDIFPLAKIREQAEH